MNYDRILAMPPFGVNQKEKEAVLLPYLKELTHLHESACPEYGKILSLLEKGGEMEKNPYSGMADIPMIPVQLFKDGRLKSIPEAEVFKVLHSSGTSGQQPSEIMLNRQTAENEQKTLIRIVENFIGKKRLPMLIIDSPEVLKNRELFSARGAGILGFSLFGRDREYALDPDMKLNLNGVRAFLKRHEGETILIFGFTYMIWKYFCMELVRTGEKLNLKEGVLIHGGGFKKLRDEAVSNEEMKRVLQETTALTRIYNYYGMVEQTGSIYMECECGHLHASSYSEVIMRRPADFSICGTGEKGVIQLLSPAAESYPGHSLLTEDEGVILGSDDCPCGRKGKYFKVFGRIPKAELRGCSDTFAYDDRGNLPPVQEEKVRCPRETEQTEIKILQPFSPSVLSFLEELSAHIRRSETFRLERDIRAFGFWCRRSHLMSFQKKYNQDRDRLGKGLIFHIAPSNIDTMFAYSLVIGLLAGNSNIVRLSERMGPAGRQLKALIEETVRKPEYGNEQKMIRFLEYKRSDTEKTRGYSAACDVRMIWGGNRTIEQIRRFPLKARALEYTFADRRSLLLLSAEKMAELKEESIRDLAHRFYMDTYEMDQRACSSPSLVVWLGEESEDKRSRVMDRWWKTVFEEAKAYDLAPFKVSRKYENLCRDAMKNLNVEKISGYANLLYVIHLKSLPQDSYACSGEFGTFYECEIGKLNELSGFLSEQIQTLTYFGFEAGKLKNFILENRLRGVDRVVPMGQAMTMDLTWDGINLIDGLSRKIN